MGLGAGCSEEPQTVLGQEIQILMDPIGIPHIYANTDEDALFGSGYIMARMRLFQLDLVRRQARGTQAEVLGESGLRGDLAARAFRFAELGALGRQRLVQEKPEHAALISAFVRGINHHIARVKSGEAPTPREFAELGYLPEPFSEDDPYSIGKMLSFGMSSSLDSELLATALGKLAPSLSGDFPLCMPTRPAFTMPNASQIMPLLGGPPGPSDRPLVERIGEEGVKQLAESLRGYTRLSRPLGSNNWAVAGKLTENGKPLLAGDPHQPLGNPSRFFAQHISSIESGGTLDVIGFGFTGAPGVQLGHNRRLGWTATTNFADVMDLWSVEHADAEHIKWGSKNLKVEIKRHAIRVRTGMGPVGASSSEERTFEVTEVPGAGVLLPEELLPIPKSLLVAPKRDILFAWTGFATTVEAETYLGMGLAKNLDEWHAAASQLEVGAANFVAADASSIRYRVHAQVPDRGAIGKDVRPWQMMDGNDPRTVWSGAFLSDDKLPQARDPERGYLATANNEPWGFTADGRVDNDPFYYGYFYDPGDRAGRIESELRRLIREKPGKISGADMITLQNDAKSTLADDLIPPLGEAMANIGTDPALAAYKNRTELALLFGRLAAWDRQMRRGSSDAVIFFAYAHFATRRALSDELGPFLWKIFDAEPAFAYKPLRLALRDVAGTSGLLQEGKRVTLVGALADTADWLKSRFGTVLPEGGKTYAWSDVHGARFDHALGGKYNGGISPVDGSVGTVNVSSATMFDGSGMVKKTWSSDDGSLFRIVVGFDQDGWPRAQVNFPRGNDSNPDSPFYNNMQPAWIDGKSTIMRFRRAEVESAVEQRITIRRDGSVR